MKVLLILLFSGIIPVALSQKTETIPGSPDKLGYVDFLLLADQLAPSEVKLPFSSIKIIDSRFDTSKIGFVPIEYYVPTPTAIQQVISFKKISINAGISNSIESYYNAYYKNSFDQSGFQLLIVMKRFWISGIDNSADTRLDLVTNLKTATNFYCKWEYYIGKGDTYLPTKRIDTIIKAGDDIHSGLSEGFSKSKQDYFKFILKTLIEILDFDKAVVAYDSQNKKTLTDIHLFNNKRNSVPVLQDSVVKKGVYLNFDDFVNNRPSIIDFNIKKMKYGGFKNEPYLVKPDGELVNEYWGYSNGKEIRYRKFGNELIYRKGNTFEFYVLVKLNKISDVMAAIKGNQLYLRMPYQLDMETGLPY